MLKDEGLHLGQLIKKMFQQKEISVREFAEQSGRTTQAVYSLLRTKNPRFDIVLEVSMMVGFKFFVQSLIQSIDELKQSIPSDDEKIGEAIEMHGRELAEERKQEIAQYLERIESLNQRIKDIEQSISLAEQVISLKDELITQLKKSN